MYFWQVMKLKILFFCLFNNRYKFRNCVLLGGLKTRVGFLRLLALQHTFAIHSWVYDDCYSVQLYSIYQGKTVSLAMSLYSIFLTACKMTSGPRFLAWQKVSLNPNSYCWVSQKMAFFIWEHFNPITFFWDYLICLRLD